MMGYRRVQWKVPYKINISLRAVIWHNTSLLSMTTIFPTAGARELPEIEKGSQGEGWRTAVCSTRGCELTRAPLASADAGAEETSGNVLSDHSRTAASHWEKEVTAGDSHMNETQVDQTPDAAK